MVTEATAEAVDHDSQLYLSFMDGKATEAIEQRM
jgi:hypothetical protein